jgi:hypothetical protein
MIRWLSRIWHGEARELRRAASHEIPPSDDPVAELAALIERGDTSQESLDRIHKLLHDRR